MIARIASLLSSATEMLFAIGLGDRVVAVSHECDWPREVAQLPRATFSRIEATAPSRGIDEQVRELSAAGAPLYGLDVDLLGRLAPELIVTQKQCDVCAVRYADVVAAVASDPRLRDTRILALNPLGLAEVLEDIRHVGEAAGVPEVARRCIASLESRVAAIRHRTAGLSAGDRPRLVCIEWTEPLMLAANWVPELIVLAGGRNGLSIGGRHSVYHDWADVVAYDPQVIVVSPCGFDLARTRVEARGLAQLPGWSDCSAVRSGRVFAVNGNAYLNRSGPRLVESVEILAHLLHPNIFAAPMGPGISPDAWQQC
jgi:iron complex transport system substrate-binding protein